MDVLTADSERIRITELAGAKGGNLHELTTHGLDVPAWAIIGLDVFRRFLADGDIAGKLNELLSRVEPATVAETAARAEELIMAGPLSPAVLSAIRAAYEHVGQPDVAVRSSGAEEDGVDFSFAGQFTTFLNVRGLDAVIERVRGCWASAFSERAFHYRLQQRLAMRQVGVAVIVQRMVPAMTSGVLFTVDPTGRGDDLMISSVFGLGEGLVSGAVDADTVVVDRTTGATVRTMLGDKQERYVPRATGQGIAVTEVAEAERARLCLDAAEIDRLVALAGRVEEIFQAPQDVEWALADGTLWILQSRPITGLASGELRVWDNSNIIESFNGVTSPLTYSFAKRVYQRVYEQYAKVLRIPEEQRDQMREWLPFLLGYFHGRVYYNLLNWYRIAGLAPLYRFNRRVLELYTGVEPLSDSIADGIRPYIFRSRWVERRNRVRLSFVFAFRFLRIHREVRAFLRDFENIYREYDGIEYKKIPADETYRKFHAMERAVTVGWGPMMVLDASIGLSFGALQLLTQRWLPNAPTWFNWAIVSPGPDVESAEPARRLSRIAEVARADPGSARLTRDTPPAQTYEALQAEGHTELIKLIDAYIADFGYRSLDELKLEVPDLREDPSGLFIMVRDALAENPTVELGGKDAALGYLNEHLRGPRRAIYKALRHRVRNSMIAREQMRLARTRVFGVAKRMLRGMGHDLARAEIIAEWNDVFYLSLEELLGCVGGTIGHSEVGRLVNLRKEQEAANHELDAPARFKTYGAVYGHKNLELAGWTAKGDLRKGPVPGLLRGTPSCPGTVEGEAKILEAPHDVNGAILATYRTDPGWVAALPSASALLIERGSPLTHVAIVARELGIPTVVQIKDLTRHLRTGMRVRVDGAAGTVEILDVDAKAGTPA